MTRRSILLSAAAAAVGRFPPQWISIDMETRSESLQWTKPDCAVNMGSLLKPFLAAAYGANHDFYPVIRCTGIQSNCWYGPGHGRQTFTPALANSCNTYFLALANMLDRASLDTVCLACGLQPPSRTLTAARLIGLAEGWPQSPLQAARAFRNLLQNRNDRAIQTVLGGMALCAKTGTARGIGLSCYAKTGTGPCSHTPPGMGDGFAVAIYPLDQPRQLILAERHNTTGANAVRDIGRLVAEGWQ